MIHSPMGSPGRMAGQQLVVTSRVPSFNHFRAHVVESIPRMGSFVETNGCILARGTYNDDSTSIGIFL